MTAKARGPAAAIGLRPATHAGPGPADLITGTDATDYLIGTAGNDTLKGYDGDDVLAGMAGDDRLDGGGGEDVAVYFEATGPVTVNLGSGKVTGASGNDTLVAIEDVWGSPFNDSLSGDVSDNRLFGDAGDDQLRGSNGDDVLAGGTGDDRLDGGLGVDTADYTFADGAVQADLQSGRATGADGTDTLVSIESLFGSAYDDTLSGDALQNYFFGEEGDDTIDGQGGYDYASFFSGIEEATIRYDAATGWLTVSTPLDGTDHLKNIESLYFADEQFLATLFTTTAPPSPIAFGPENGSHTASAGGNLRLTFSEPVHAGSGSIVLRDAAGNEVERFDVASSGRLKFSGNNLVVDPSATLARGTTYHLELPAGAVLDAQNQPNAAFDGYRFTTSTAPELSLPEQLSVAEGSGSFTVRLDLGGVSTQPVKATLTVAADSTASDPADIVAFTRDILIEPGQSELLVTVSLPDDGIVEPTEGFHLRLSNANGVQIGNSETLVLITDDDALAGTPPADPLQAQQWHLYPGPGADVLAVWPDYTGAGVRIGVFDQGIDATLPDLQPNTDQAAGRRTADLAAGGAPVGSGDNHGTLVAGVIGAARNGIDGVGVAYGATLVSLYSPLDKSSTPAEIANAFGYAKQLDILNDSWGYAPQYYLSAPWAFEDNFLDDAFRASGAALKALAEEGRHGLGTVVVQSAGNSFSFGDDTNLHNFQNSRYIITVAATDVFGEVTSYSSPGASILVAAPGGDGGGRDDLGNILTTDRAGTLGLSEGDTVRAAGTSFSAPVVSGVVALMLQANPELGYRDVQQILAYSAHITGGEQELWRTNGAADWNGGGLHYDAETHDLGFGLVDGRAAVRLAESWRGSPATSANDVELSASRHTAVAIPDGTSSVRQSVTIQQPLVVERAEVTVDITHGHIGDLALLLESPSGTSSWLLSRPGQVPLTAFGNDQDDIHFTFDTVLSLGESSLGEWSLTVYDLKTGESGTLDDWTLNLVGRPASDDNTYFYSDEYAQTLASLPARGTLSDSGGHDTVNASMVTGNSLIDLQPGAVGRIAGQPFTIATGTQIEQAWGGDGADSLLGNDAANELHGMRGNDSLDGRAGDDLVDGGAGFDTACFAGPRARYAVQRGSGPWTVEDRQGSDGRDTLQGIERLQFSDGAVAYDTAANEPAGQVAQILRGLFGQQGLANPVFAGIGLKLMDQGMGYEALVAAAISTPQFEQLAGSHAHADIVRLVYQNVVGSAPSAAELAQYTALLDNGSFTPAALAALACHSELNSHSVELMGLLQTGLDYLPPAT
ncbi:S8 family serine peptidase [Aquabacterium sp.]|uniref:S8 family serine peptidase n=1 Tax=Aquabacterium sp. TaxID=1872578 RepID=UPI0037834829